MYTLTKHDNSINTLRAAVICRKLAKKRQLDFFYISEYAITHSLTPEKGMQSTSYLVVGSQRVNCKNIRQQIINTDEHKYDGML